MQNGNGEVRTDTTYVVSGFHYASPGWLVTARHKESGELQQFEVKTNRAWYPVMRATKLYDFVSACRVMCDYDPVLHDLATCLATFRTHP